jgi:UDPglucose 6-dehydrogenase
VVIGAAEERDAARVATLYDGVDAPIVITDRESAEMIKYAANAFLATKISYVNELASACEVLGADVQEVVRGLGYDPRIGFGWLNPGPGWGGSCLPKDTAGFIHTTSAAGYEFQLLRCAVEVNEQQRRRVIEKVQHAVGGPLRGARVALWGAAFKANTDDLRESPALQVAAALVADGASVVMYDPAVSAAAITARVPIEVGDDLYKVCAGAQVLVVVTEWPQFAQADLQLVAQQMAAPRIVDARNVLDPKHARDAGFAYWSLGRG